MIDDNEDDIIILKKVLEKNGFEIITAANAVEAGVMLSSHMPSIILMDINMPGIDGLDAVSAIRRNPAAKDIPIIIVTGSEKPGDMNRALKLGASDFFLKPADSHKLIKRINEILAAN